MEAGESQASSHMTRDTLLEHVSPGLLNDLQTETQTHHLETHVLQLQYQMVNI